MALALILVPLAIAALAAVLSANRWRPWLLPVTGVTHTALVLCILAGLDAQLGLATPASIATWLVLDPPGKIVLLQISVLFLLCSFYTVGYLQYRQERSNRTFCVCLLTFLGVMSLVIGAHHLGVMWVAIEFSTLVTAPLIFYNRTQRSIEATWKYLLVGSVGIAMALLGTFFLAYSSLHAGLDATLTFEELLRDAPKLSKPWLHAAFVLLLVGYGTKMGLAPMHTWKPDAYGEAPGVVGAMLAGGVTNCAFLALLRIYHIANAAGEAAYTSRLLLFMGLFSMATAGLFMVGQRDIKRMLAYSSVEHMGILVLGLGIGSTALYGTLLHVLTNGMTKGVLFLSAANIHRAYASKSTDQVSGAMRRLPLSGTLFLVGFLAITGSPPFGPFVSEFSILNGAFDAGRFVTGAFFLVFLLVVFIGMGATVLHVVQGRPPDDASSASGAKAAPFREGILTGTPIAIFMLLVLLMGVFIPAPLKSMLDEAVRFVGGQR